MKTKINLNPFDTDFVLDVVGTGTSFGDAINVLIAIAAVVGIQEAENDRYQRGISETVMHLGASIAAYQNVSDDRGCDRIRSVSMTLAIPRLFKAFLRAAGYAEQLIEVTLALDAPTTKENIFSQNSPLQRHLAKCGICLTLSQ